MKLQLAAAFLLTFAIPFQTTSALANTPSRATQSPDIVLKLSDLRSAYLIRAGVVHYDANATSPAQLRAQLQRHFDVVIGLLMVSTPNSIETAIARLEGASAHAWTEAERDSWRQKLLATRYLQLQRLAAYRDRGLFPLNEGQANQPVPIFVDAHDTACAVGQLMRWNGWLGQVADIHDTNNLIYVPDAERSAVTAWVLTSGLTFEEAALIQPGYAFQTPFLASDYEPGELTFVKDGLRFQNFRLDAQNFSKGPSSPFTFHELVTFCDGCTFDPISQGSRPSLSGIGINAGSGLVSGGHPADTLSVIGNRWLVLGGTFNDLFGTPNRLINANAPNFAYAPGVVVPVQWVELSFDVSTVNPGTYFTQIAEHNFPTYSGFAPNDFNNPGQYEFTTTATMIPVSPNPFDVPLASVNFTELPLAGQFERRSASSHLSTFTNQLHVSTTIWLYNGEHVGSYVLGFQVVPEPTTFALAMVAVFGGMRRWRRT